MEQNQDLANAAIVGENPEMLFIIQKDRLHAVDPVSHKGVKASPEVLSFLRKAWQVLLKYSEGKIHPQALESLQKSISLKKSEEEQLREKICSIYAHLPHHIRIELSALIHHPQKV